MLREVQQPGEPEEQDRGQRLREACRLLRWIDPELAEWTTGPMSQEGQYVTAHLLLSDAQAPLEQLAGVLRRIADQLERLAGNQRLRFPESSP